MATQMQLARKGIITEAMKQVAAYEGVTEEFIRKGVAEGTIAIPLNINHKNVTPRGVGQGLSVKVNANIGTSSSYPDPEPELEKLAAAIAAGADSVMDYRCFAQGHYRRQHGYGGHGANLPGNRGNH